jgi:hypothetical protein
MQGKVDKRDIRIDFFADTFRSCVLQVDEVEMRKLTRDKRTEIVCNYIQGLLRTEFNIYKVVKIITWKFI